MYQLFIFFMITDPKTTVRSKKWQCVVVFLVALVEMILRLDQIVYAPFYALFIVGPTAMLIEIWLDSRASAEKLAVAGSADHVGTAALGCPVERARQILSMQIRSLLAGQPRAAVPRGL